MAIRVFVYGTLLRGQSNHGYISAARLAAEQASVEGRLYDTGNGYPALRIGIAGEGGRVYGELYDVNEEALAALDALEDYYGPGDRRNEYERVRVEVRTDRGSVSSWTYAYSTDPKGRFEPIPLGDWRVHCRIVRSADRSDDDALPQWLYFAYGSCMDDRRFREHGVLSSFSDEVGRGTLNGYRLRFTCRLHDGGRADLVEEGGAAEGKLYRVGTEAASYLWRREGVEGGVYRPTFVTVRLDDGSFAEALTFLVVEKREETAPPAEYMEEILRGARTVVSESYYAELERMAAAFRTRRPSDER